MPEREPEKRALFALGQLLATPGALDLLQTEDILPIELITRHVTGDWSEMVAEDQQANADAVARGLRVFSSYALPSGAKIWLITEWDRSVTTILRPQDY